MSSPFENSWFSWGVSVRGPAHIRASIPNQDYWVARNFVWGNVVAISDGLGSKPLSHHGSREACNAVITSAKEYSKNPNGSLKDILRLIQANWLFSIGPHSADECSATCLFVIRCQSTLLLGRLGDGMIAAIDAHKNEHLLLADDKADSFSNITVCLSSRFRFADWEIIQLPADSFKAIVLCTDGIADDLIPDRMKAFALDIYDSYKNKNKRSISLYTRRWMRNWPVKGHSDDKTIACLFRERNTED